MMGQKIFEHTLRICSGDGSKSEQLGLGDYEFVPWNIDVVG
jgi:altronate hydrolase